MEEEGKEEEEEEGEEEKPRPAAYNPICCIFLRLRHALRLKQSALRGIGKRLVFHSVSIFKGLEVIHEENGRRD